MIMAEAHKAYPQSMAMLQRTHGDGSFVRMNAKLLYVIVCSA